MTEEGLQDTRISKIRKLKTIEKDEKSSKIADFMNRKRRNVQTTKDKGKEIEEDLMKTTRGKVLKKKQNDVKKEFPENPVKVLILAYPR